MTRICLLALSTFFFTSSLFGADLIVSGDLRGEIKPCGCAEEGDMGGLLRRATFLKQQEGAVYLDLGNNFPEPSEQGNLKVEVIHTALRQMGPAVILVGPNEWLYGLDSLAEDLPYFLSNQDGTLPFQQEATVSFEGTVAHLRGFLSPTLIYQNENEAPRVYGASQALATWERSGAFEVLLFRGTDAELAQFQESGQFDLILSGSTNADELKQVMTRTTDAGTVAMIPTKGQGLLQGVWQPEQRRFVATGEVTATPQFGVDWLRRSVPDDPPLSQAFQEYDDRVKELFFTNLDRMEQQQQQSPFVGAAVCEACHAEAAKVWKSSRHAHAFATLEAKDKHFDPECLECHVVGLKPWQPTPGSTLSPDVQAFVGKNGFLSPQLTPHLMNVQCESCHGPARAHIAQPEVVKMPQVAANACTTCHMGSHSPLFNFETYWPKIQHGKEPQ